MTARKHTWEQACINLPLVTPESYLLGPAERAYELRIELLIVGTLELDFDCHRSGLFTKSGEVDIRI